MIHTAELKPLRAGLWSSGTALLASTGTLVCCALPAAMVSLGAGAALAGLVSAVPQLIWLSEQKALVFGVATLSLVVAGGVLWHSRTLPCPADPALAAACERLRTASRVLFGASVAFTAIGALFAFALPALLT